MNNKKITLLIGDTMGLAHFGRLVPERNCFGQYAMVHTVVVDDGTKSCTSLHYGPQYPRTDGNDVLQKSSHQSRLHTNLQAIPTGNRM